MNTYVDDIHTQYFYLQTRMHSSRMRTAHTLMGGGGGGGDCKRQKKKMTQTPYTVCELY